MIQLPYRKEQEKKNSPESSIRPPNVSVPLECILQNFIVVQYKRQQAVSPRTLHQSFELLPSGSCFRAPLTKKIKLLKPVLFPLQSAFEIKDDCCWFADGYWHMVRWGCGFLCISLLYDFIGYGFLWFYMWCVLYGYVLLLCFNVSEPRS